MKFNKLPPELKDLEVGLKKLDFSNNFRSFEVTLTIPAGSSARIPNQMSPTIPSKRIIARASGTGEISDDNQKVWTSEALYLFNNGAGASTVTVIFLE